MPSRAPIRRTCWKWRWTSPGYASGDTMNVAVTATTAGRLTLNVFTDRLVASQSQDVPRGHGEDRAAGRPRLGHRRVSRRHLAPPARRPGAAHAGPRHRRAVVLHRPRRAHARARHDAARQYAAGQRAERSDQDRRTRTQVKKRASSSLPSTSAFSTSPTTSRRRRTTTIWASAASPRKCAISTGS